MTADDLEHKTAYEVIERMKLARPTCEDDETIPFYASLRGPRRAVGPPGFEPDPNFAGYRKRCEKCANGKLFPWAADLDPARVQAFIEQDPRCQHGAWELELLKETLITAYQQAVDEKLKNIMQSIELFGLSMDLYGVPPTEIGLCMLAQQAEHDAFQAALEKHHEAVGQELLKQADAFFREVTPAEQAENEAFAVKFMGREIPGITGPVREVLLEQPYRTVLITGIAPLCPHVGCEKKGCNGNHEVTGPHTDKPTGGFEFL